MLEKLNYREVPDLKRDGSVEFNSQPSLKEVVEKVNEISRLVNQLLPEEVEDENN